MRLRLTLALFVILTLVGGSAAQAGPIVRTAARFQPTWGIQ